MSTNNGTQDVTQSSNYSVSTFFSSLVVSFAIFGVEVLLFLFIKNKLPRIYQPRTYLVPEKERTQAPPPGLWKWALPIFRTSNSDFIQKCGLDAYFFLRYLRLLLKLFIPMAAVILPILLPLNAVDGKGPTFTSTFPYSNDKTWTDVEGLNTLAWTNVRPDHYDRYWAHTLLALGVIIYTCYISYDELRGFIRLRQAYLTSPQHRLRASATTVLVSAIPRKWCTAEALDGLYDVFPGGIRNIWINRDYQTLNDKVDERNKIAQMLEQAQTNLIKKAKSVQMAELKKQQKKAGQKQSKEQRAAEKQKQDEAGAAMAESQGVSTGDPHQIRHNVHAAAGDVPSSDDPTPRKEKRNPLVPIPVVGEGLDAVGQGISFLGKSVFGGINSVRREVNAQLETTQGFVASDGDSMAPRGNANDLNFGPSYHLDEESPDIPQTERDHMDGAGSETELNGAKTTSPLTNPAGRFSTNDAATPRTGVSTGGQNGSVARYDRAPERTKKNKATVFDAKKENLFDMPSPEPKGVDEAEYPLGAGEHHHVADANLKVSGMEDAEPKAGQKKMLDSLKFWESSEPPAIEYPDALDESYNSLEDGEPLWKKYLKPKDRETVRLPIFGVKSLWFLSSVPFVGKKVDTIDFCRKELARLNTEIEADQKHPERYPLMNSAFIQFNHQVAAHMACQAVSHHVPIQMAPRTIEISPDDVIWENMSIKWWERYLRTGIIFVVIVALVIGWAVPVSFTAALANISGLAQQYSWLRGLDKIPSWLINPIQGVLPQLLLSILLILLPYILRYLAKLQGVATGMQVELATQNFYFAFLFVQIFLVVTISAGLSQLFSQLASTPQSVPVLLSQNLPKASNYFFSYMLLQALSTSAGVLLQIAGLVGWFVLAPLLDSTARQKWSRQINLPQINWGTFFPVFTNLAVIGLIYSIIAPLILIFNIITFGLFWFVYRYNTLYVTKFRFDTGGLLFPQAVNQLFTGLYVLEICMIGLFSLLRTPDAQGHPTTDAPCLAQTIVMIVAFLFTILFQWLLNNAFGPLFRYLPITLEDEAVDRDEAFARAQQKKFNLVDEEQEGDDINEVLEERERRSEEEDNAEDAIELRQIDGQQGRNPNRAPRHRLDPRSLASAVPGAISSRMPLTRASWADRSRRRSANWVEESAPSAHDATQPQRDTDDIARKLRLGLDKLHLPTADAETQRGNHALGHALFSGINDEIEDLGPDERDRLVQRAFQHQALRARRPVIWVPRDDLGVSDDEIARTRRLSKAVWISNEYTGLDGRARVVYRKSPPDFSEIDLIDL